MTKNLGFLTFGHHQDIPGSQARTAQQALTQAIDTAVGAEELGFDGAWIRVHHYQRQFATPWALLSALAARTSRIELGTAVVDMRYENPLIMAELAATADLISGGRLQLGLSRGSQEPALRGYEAFGVRPTPDDTINDIAERNTARFRDAISGVPMAITDPEQTRRSAPLPVEPRSDTLPGRIWWGSATRRSAHWAGTQGMNLLSSTLLSEDTGVPFATLQAEQIQTFRDAWARAGHPGTPRVAVTRSILPIVSAQDRAMFGTNAIDEHVGVLGGAISRFGKNYIGPPDTIAADLAEDEAVTAADTLLVTIPNLLGVAANLRVLSTIAEHVAPTLN
ncbi:LLM class flavin-dependent oxidoreductase [Rhodococcus globerulus]|jgi:alkanesulfonate monooxygenase SsuD/methylene tetrahydromethanopterin reductase-like flavin-dependent oxidoreductase (luciferase family)|uniref:LLM class flavin-dependent oxidoreductase n=1 Tax=Rhodococcus globerulus TaxID=33008 RepID=UPI001F2E08BB|nr:LLM class flavin-dependent oxidoreductase [Rhodococcus globerulus]MCE4267679.1 LLM class flavin-dependent oxidoreductase [Rhodococcus globerulus]